MTTFGESGADAELAVVGQLDVSGIAMLDALQAKTDTLKSILETMSDPAKIGPSELLEMQRQMNLLSQIAESSIAVLSALHKQVESLVSKPEGG